MAMLLFHLVERTGCVTDIKLCSKIDSTPAERYGIQIYGLDTSYPDWGFLFSFSVPSGNTKDGVSNSPWPFSSTLFTIDYLL